MIAKETIDEVKSRVQIVDIVSEIVNLKSQSGRYLGLCPFHSEKTPSFHVKSDEGYWHCFGCGKSGNAISFIMETKGYSFPEAIEYLAEKYNIEVKRKNSSLYKPTKDYKKVLIEINKFALDFYVSCLQQKNLSLLRYVKERNLTKEAFSVFKLGFAPLNNEFTQTATKHFDNESLLKSGLVRRSEKGFLYDSLRGRIVFPIISESNKIIGFGGRLIPGIFNDQDSSPKYINSPENELYSKSVVLYGINSALESIRESKECYVVEGYLDVISLYQQGVKNVVATCGTALTKQHVEKLSRLSKKVVLLFDGDTAGRSAAGKSFANFIDAQIDVWAVYLPSGLDPDNIANTYLNNTAKFLDDLPRVSLLDAFIDYQLLLLKEDKVENLGSSSIAKIANELNSIFSSVVNKAALDVLIRQASSRLRISAKAFNANENHGVNYKNIKSNEENILANKTFNSLNSIEKQILKLTMAKKEIYVDKVLSDPTLLGSLSSIVIEFVQLLKEILDLNLEKTEAKKAVKTLLSNYDQSWTDAWREAYRFSYSAKVDLNKEYQECLLSIKRFKNNQLALELQTKAQFCQDPAEKSLILQQILQLKRQAVG